MPAGIKDSERREIKIKNKKKGEKLEAQEKTVIPRPRPKAAYCRL